MIFGVFSHVQKIYSNFTSIHQFSLPSSTMSPYFNYIFHTVSNFFQYISKKFSPETQWGGFNPQNPPCQRLCSRTEYLRAFQIREAAIMKSRRARVHDGSKGVRTSPGLSPRTFPPDFALRTFPPGILPPKLIS